MILALLTSCTNKGQDTALENNAAHTMLIDEDNDGFSIPEDCDDSDPTTIDDMDCDGTITSQDCDDTNSNIYPGAPEDPNNGVDDDCDGDIDEATTTVDDDGDGYCEPADDDNPWGSMVAASNRLVHCSGYDNDIISIGDDQGGAAYDESCS